MKIRIFLLFGVFCFALIETGCLAQKESVKEVEQEINDPYSWDFGAVKEGEVLKHDFVLKNAAKEILNIKDVNTSCGCTVSKVKKKTLLPAEETLIGVQFNTKGYSGAVEQYIYIHTDSLDNPIIRFIIKAKVVKNK